MLAPNDGLASTITDIIYVYIKSEFPETIKIDILLYICSVLWEVIWGFLSHNEAIMHPKFAPEVWFHNGATLTLQIYRMQAGFQ